jgi:putative DNA primase/helicase
MDEGLALAASLLERGERLAMNRLSDVEIKPIQWLWPGYFARGKISLIVGNPGISKSITTIDIAARVTRGGRWPDGQLGDTAASVIFITTEDDADDTIRPRAECADADCSKIYILEAVEKDDVVMAGRTIAKSSQRGFDLARDLPLLRVELERIKDVALIVIDPIPAIQPGINSDKNNEVRSSLVGLQMLAKEFRVAVVGIMHLNKSTVQEVIHRTSGSVAYVAVARSVFLIAEKREQLDQILLFLPVKNNIASSDKGLSFRLVPRLTESGFEMRGLEWLGPTTISATEALAQPKPRREGDGSEKLDSAKAFLVGKLADGPKLSKELEEEARQDGISKPTLMRAKRALAVTHFKEGRGFSGPWFWKLEQIKIVSASSTREASMAKAIRRPNKIKKLMR